MKTRSHSIAIGAATLGLAIALSGCGKSKSAGDSAALSVSNKLAVIAAAGDPVTLEELNNRYAEPSAAENAAEIYAQAFDALIGASSIEAAKSPAFLAQNQKALTLLLQATERRACRYPLNMAEGYFVTLPHLPKIKTCALLLQSEAINQASHGRMDVATKAILAGVSLALSLQNEPIIISRLVEAASLTIAFQGLEQALTRKEFTEAQLQSLLAAIGEAGNASSFRPALVAERTFVISAFRMRSEELSKMLKETGAKNQSGLDIHAYLKSSTVQQDFNFALDYFSNLVALAEMPFPQCLTPEAQEALPKIETATSRNFKISTALLPALGNIVQRAAEAAARIRVTQTALAVERYRLKHDHALPSSLTDLTPGFIDALPADPFDGQPLRYLKFPDKGYVVYSIGKDMKDDNGTERSPDGKTQLDVTFTVKR